MVHPTPPWGYTVSVTTTLAIFGTSFSSSDLKREHKRNSSPSCLSSAQGSVAVLRAYYSSYTRINQMAWSKSDMQDHSEISSSSFFGLFTGCFFDACP
jgi:hypothetical protein